MDNNAMIDNKKEAIFSEYIYLKEIIDNSEYIAFISQKTIDWNMVYISNNINMLGYEVKEIINTKKWEEEIVLEEDRDYFIEEMQWNIANKISNFKREYRIVTKDYREIWVRDNVRLLWNSNGDAYRAEGIIVNISEEKAARQRVEEQAYMDYLTKLPNRLKCEADLAVEVNSAIDNNQCGYIMFIDLDNFKHINDGLGHEYGDILIIEMSKFLNGLTKRKNRAYRLGGDEFIVLVDRQDAHRIKCIIEEILDRFGRPWELGEREYYCTMSMGIAEFPKNGKTVKELLKNADAAMYEAKRTGKNKAEFFNLTSTYDSVKQLELEKHLRYAVYNNCEEFELFYQPIYDCEIEKCIGAEALIRWNNPILGFISPGEFIALAEYLGLIVPIGEYVLRNACETCKEWNDKGHEDFTINVNLSVVQLMQLDIVNIISSALQDTGLLPKNLIVEVTESLAINDMSRMIKILNAIKELGVSIAMDDFGIGYSSLNYIKQMPLSYIKVDRTFVKDVTEDAFTQAFIRLIVELANTMDMKICVEGIETDMQYDVMKELKVEKLQGYYFGKPVNKENFEKQFFDF